MLNSLPNEPPTHLDEVASLLVAVRHPPAQPANDRDLDYGLKAALAEVGEALEAGPGGQLRGGHRGTLAADLGRVFDRLGPSVRARLASAPALRAAMVTYAESGDRVDADAAASLMSQLKLEIAIPDIAVRAFDDLLEVAQDGSASHHQLKTALSLLIELMELGSRSPSQICQVLGGVVDDQDLEISVAQNKLDGTPIRDDEPVDRQAGMDVVARLDLARRYLELPAQSGHHVVWTAYSDARIATEGWREQVGPVELFDGPTLLRAIKDTDDTQPTRPLPEELREAPDDFRGIEDDLWPDATVVPQWIAARVDLGTRQLPNAIETGRAQADAVVQLALFANRDSTWTPLAGVIHLVDGRRHGTQGFHPADNFREIRVKNDATAEGLVTLASTVGPHLPVQDPRLLRILREIGALNLSNKARDPELLTTDFRVIEYVTSQNEDGDWVNFMKNNLATFHARGQIITEIYDATLAVIRAFIFSDRPDLEHEVLEHLGGNKVIMNRKAALDLIPYLVARIPTYHHATRRLREVERRTQDVARLRDWVDELTAEYKIKVDRAARLRNGLTHGGPASLEAARTIHVFVSKEVRTIARSTLQAILEGRQIKPVFDGYRLRDRTW